jgi:nicotinamide riboside kinase
VIVLILLLPPSARLRADGVLFCPFTQKDFQQSVIKLLEEENLSFISLST